MNCGMESDEAGDRLCEREATSFVNVLVEVENGDTRYATLHLCKTHAFRLTNYRHPDSFQRSHPRSELRDQLLEGERVRTSGTTADQQAHYAPLAREIMRRPDFHGMSYEHLLVEYEAALERIRASLARGMEQASLGKVVDLGSFESYADEPDED